MLVARLVMCGQCLLQRPLAAITAPCLNITQRRRYCSRLPTAAVLVREEHLQIRPYYGTLHLRGDLNFVVKADLEHQCGSVCRVRLFAAPGCSASIQLNQCPNKAELTVVGQRNGATQEGPEKRQTHCEITLPIKYDLSAELTGHGGLTIEELQNDTTFISTVTGVTTIRKLQCPLMRYNTHEGVLAIPGKLLASVEAQGRALTISGNAVQAGSLSLRAEEVSVMLQSVHAGSLLLEAGAATLVIKDITAASQVRANTADVRVGNCSGSMQWELKKASVRVGVPQLQDDSSITVDRGTCIIACPAEYRYGIDLRSTNVTVHPEFSNFQTITNKFLRTHQPEDSSDVFFMTQLSNGVEASGVEGEESAPMQEGRGGLRRPRLAVLVKQGAVEMIPWSWPRTPGLLEST